MSGLVLIPLTAADAETVRDYRAEFSEESIMATPDGNRIPGLDGLEDYETAEAWLEYCQTRAGEITWYKTVRESDGRMVGAACFRHRLEYDDDDPEFASHLGYSVRPSERRRGYAKEQLRLALSEAKKQGLDRVRLICRDVNEGSRRTILANGGVFADALTGEESGMTVFRFDIAL